MAEETKAPSAPAESSSSPAPSESHGHGHRPGPRGPRPGGGPGGGGGREGGRKYFRRKKVCKFCVEKIESINYKDVRLLAQFVAESGKIVPRRLTGVCTPHQRRLSSDIADALEKKSFHIDRRKIQLHEPLKSVGEFDVPVKLHKDVTAHVKVVIEKEAVE